MAAFGQTVSRLWYQRQWRLESAAPRIENSARFFPAEQFDWKMKLYGSGMHIHKHGQGWYESK